MPAVLAAYNWAPNTERYRKLSQFVDAFFTKFPTLQNPPFHPKWKEVSLSAPLAGWNRLPLAQQWLDKNGISPVARGEVRRLHEAESASGARVRSPRTTARRCSSSSRPGRPTGRQGKRPGTGPPPAPAVRASGAKPKRAIARARNCSPGQPRLIADWQGRILRSASRRAQLFARRRASGRRAPPRDDRR